MSVEYMLWVLQSTLNIRDEARQEELIKAMMTWAAEPNSVLTPSQKAEIENAYGDIAIQRGQLKEAGEIFLRTMQNKAYSNTTSRSTAALRRVTVQRIEKDFDAALQTIAELEMERVPEMWAPLRYARAEVFFDKTEYDNASEDIESILSRNPDHSEAKIMQGKLMLKRQRLMEATEVELGSADAKQVMVPGEALKVTLTDPTLAVSGIGSEIEVAVWAESGDREHVLLSQFGDQKTKFRGEIATALGAPKPDDRTLQVIGDEKIYYAYSERFRKKMNNLEEKRGGPITVASDALLMASARKLLSEAEQRVSDMQAKMDALKGASASSARAIVQAGRAAELTTGSKGESVETDRLSLEAFQNRLVEERLKPGNPVYIQVIDPDRSRTAGIDEVRVSVESSSGDAIGQIVLKETGTHTGWFTGSVPTAGGTPKAFADDSEPGRNPNTVISPLTTYPAWRPVSKAGKVPEFKIDLNDNVALGEMTITAKETGDKLKKFVVYAGSATNAAEMMLVTAYPQDLISVAKPWHPSVTIMNDTDSHHVQNLRSVYELGELQQQLDRGWLSQQFAAGISENVAGPSMAMTNSIPAKVKWLRNNHSHNAHVVYRFRGYFHEQTAVTRRFKLVLGPYAVPANTHPSVTNHPQFLLAVDGKPITSKDKPDKLEGEIPLKAGVHRFEIWATGWDCTIGFGRTVKLQANLADPASLTDCPDSFFDPEAFPTGILAPRCPRAEVSASSDGTSFNVKFAPDSKARIINLVFMGQEGSVPVLNRIRLSDTVGKQVLPVAFDFAELGKNNVLEVIANDKVTVRYEDDRFVTKEKSKHERFLNVAFTTATMQFDVFVEMRMNRQGVEFEYYENLLRYEIGMPVVLTINDSDMDVSAKPDTVQVTLESRTGKKRQFTATESGDSTGIFRLTVTPVAGVPANEKQIQVSEGEVLTAVYRDVENNDPGVPADRYASLRHATFVEPAMFISHATVSPIPATNLPPAVALNEGFSTAKQDFQNTRKMTIAQLRAYWAGKGMIQPRWQVSHRLCQTATPPTNGFESVLGLSLSVDIEAAHLALRVNSVVEVYVQTEAGRKLVAQDRPAADAAAGTAVKPPVFDVTVPGTMAIAAGIWFSAEQFQFGTSQIPIYQEGGWARDGKLTDGRFTCSVPLIPNVIPDHGILSAEEYEQRRKAGTLTQQIGLAVKPGDTVHVGFRYTDRDGTEKWLTGSAKIITHPVLDVMEKYYSSAKTNAYVGESLALRVVDLGADVTDRSDTVSVLVQAKSGAKQQVELKEVDTHSGVFKGSCQLTYVTAVNTATANTNEAAAIDIKKEGFPVVYGDKLGARYTDSNGVKTDPVLLTISKGADGAVAPFSKKYEDPEMAVRTHFAIAESSLEVAKAYRASGDHAKADREYAVAKQMLAGTLDKFRDPETRSQAEFILGNLTFEEADTTKKTDMKEDLYRAALSRYMNVIGSYPDTLHASKAQFKIATVYEKLKEPDIAAQEYVKLAYKYPDSEFLAIAMARLGTHFQRKADEYEKKAKPLLEKKDNKDALFEGTAVQKMAVAEYLKAAKIFDRMQTKFPDHEMAGKCGLRAGQSYMRAGDNRRAVSVFNRVVKNDSYDGPEVRAQALYWAGMSYESLGESMAAYSSYKRLTYDFPESTWASYARAQLSQDGLMNLETDLEIKRLEEGR
jgi:tetratricopeptide (TPR) repeat protein